MFVAASLALCAAISAGGPDAEVVLSPTVLRPQPRWELHVESGGAAWATPAVAGRGTQLMQAGAFRLGLSREFFSTPAGGWWAGSDFGALLATTSEGTTKVGVSSALGVADVRALFGYRLRTHRFEAIPHVLAATSAGLGARWLWFDGRAHARRIQLGSGRVGAGLTLGWRRAFVRGTLTVGFVRTRPAIAGDLGIGVRL